MSFYISSAFYSCTDMLITTDQLNLLYITLYPEVVKSYIKQWNWTKNSIYVKSVFSYSISMVVSDYMYPSMIYKQSNWFMAKSILMRLLGLKIPSPMSFSFARILFGITEAMHKLWSSFIWGDWSTCGLVWWAKMTTLQHFYYTGHEFTAETPNSKVSMQTLLHKCWSVFSGHR